MPESGITKKRCANSHTNDQYELEMWNDMHQGTAVVNKTRM